MVKCLIQNDNNQYKNIIANGFICKQNISNIKCYNRYFLMKYVLDSNYINQEKIIKINYKNEEKILQLKNGKIKYKNENWDYIIIEINNWNIKNEFYLKEDCFK